MSYDREEVIRSYTTNADREDQAEKGLSLRTQIPREYIKRYIRSSDRVLDAGGGTGINAIMMAGLCRSVTLLDVTPQILDLARRNIRDAGLQDRVDVVEGDICDLGLFEDGRFSFVVCVGDALSYVLDRRAQAMRELVRVAQRGSMLILGTDSKCGFLRLRLAQRKMEEAREILRIAQTYCGMGPRTHLYTVDEMRSLLEDNGCELLEVASTPSLSDTIDVAPYVESDQWEALKELELEIGSTPELLGTGLHLLFVARKGQLCSPARRGAEGGPVNVREHNRLAWDRQVEGGNPWTVPVSPEEVAAARVGEWVIYLTPTKAVPHDWLPDLHGARVLCLASGGGQQGPILAAAGAEVTVLDNSPRQLERDRDVAQREGLAIATVEGDMADLAMFRDRSFDAIVHPVSNVFVPDVRPVWREAYRVLRSGGVLVAGFDNPIVHAFDYALIERTGKLEVVYALPYSDLEHLSEAEKQRYREEGIPFEFSHTLEEQIGGQIEAGFAITGFYEDRDREGEESPLHDYMPSYIATRATKLPQPAG